MDIFEISDVTYLYMLTYRAVFENGHPRAKPERRQLDLKGSLAISRKSGGQNTSSMVFHGASGQTTVIGDPDHPQEIRAAKFPESAFLPNAPSARRNLLWVDWAPDHDDTGDVLKIDHSFLCKHEADMDHFVAAWETEREFAGQRAAFFEELVRLVRSRCKSQALVDFRTLAEDLHEAFAQFESWNPGSDPVATLEFVCRELIDEGTLSGVTDEHAHVYTHPSFNATRQRVVNINVAMDFNALVQQLGNKGVSLSTVECPQCGSMHAIPNQGSVFTCGACGSVIQATDIFEKFRALF